MDQSDLDRIYRLLEADPDSKIPQKLWDYLYRSWSFHTDSMVVVPDWGARTVTISGERHEWSTDMALVELQRIVRTHMVAVELRQRGAVVIGEKEADDWRDLDGVRLEDLVRLGFQIPEPALERSAARMPGVRNDVTLDLFLEEEPPGTHEYLLSKIAAAKIDRSDAFRIGYNIFNIYVDVTAQTARVAPILGWQGPPTEMPLQEFIDRIC